MKVNLTVSRPAGNTSLPTGRQAKPCNAGIVDMGWVTKALTKSEVQSRLGREESECFAFKGFRYKASPVSPPGLFWRVFETLR